MRLYRHSILCLFFFCTAHCSSQATSWYRPTCVRAALVVIRQDAIQIIGSGAGPGLFLGAQFEPADRLHVITGIGIYKATDDLMKWDKRVTEQMPSIEIKAEYSLFTPSNISPYLSCGLQVCNSIQYEKSEDGYLAHHQAWLAGYMTGVGVSYSFYKPWIFFIEGEYRKSFMIQNGYEPVYWAATVGFSFHLSLPETERIPRPQDFLEIARNKKEGPSGDVFTFQNKDQSGIPDFLQYYIQIHSAKNSDNMHEKNDNEKQPWIRKSDMAIIRWLTNPDSVHKKNDNEKQPGKLKSHVSISEEMDEIMVKYRSFFEDIAGLRSFKNAYQQGLVYLNDNNYKASFIIFDYLIKKYSNSPLKSNCYYWLGRSLYEYGLYENAENAFKHAVIEVSSTKYPDSYYYLGLCLIKKRKFHAAKLFFYEYVKRYPDQSYSYHIRKYMKKEYK